MKKRIVITGMGILTTLGDNLTDFYSNLINFMSENICLFTEK